MEQKTLVGNPGVGATRDALDRHYTPLPLAEIICQWIAKRVDPMPAIVVEPSLGGGSFARAARRTWSGCRVVGVDIDPLAEGRTQVHSFHDSSWPIMAPLITRASLVIGNPPFTGSTAIRHVEAALAMRSKPVVAMILPWSFMGGVQRWDHLMTGSRAPQHALTIAPRPWGDKIRETAVFVWTREENHSGITQVERLPRWR